MKTRILLFALLVSGLALMIEGCSTTKTVTPAAKAEITSAVDINPGDAGTNGTPGGTNVLLTPLETPYSLTNAIYPAFATSGFYIYAVSIGHGWGYVTNQPPFSISFAGTNLLGYFGAYGDNATGVGTITLTNIYSPAYRFDVYAGDDGTHGTNYPLTMIGFALPMMITVSNTGPAVHLSVYGLLKDFNTYQIQSSSDLKLWSTLVAIPGSNATYTADVPETNAAGFFRVVNVTTNQ